MFRKNGLWRWCWIVPLMLFWVGVFYVIRAHVESKAPVATKYVINEEHFRNYVNAIREQVK